VPAGSNATFVLALVDAAGDEHLAIYKPKRGERPLWDFPDGTLYKREAATYLVSSALGWDIVPPTVIREGPYGVGSFQVFCDPDEETDFWRVRPKRRAELLKIAVFDVVTNNADRKGEHCLVARDGRIYGIDNGLTFHPEFKNRTVLADFAGEPVPSAMVAELRAILEPGERRRLLEASFAPLLAPEEIDCFFRRVAVICRTGRMPRVIPHWELYYLSPE
ncbi:MAG: SCO1664 family protein, partial [Dehalococcoidia bacterium]|nr:SCO1664 family protein [Dehalococcoidia bacterium]